MKEIRKALMTASCCLAAGYALADDLSIGSYEGAPGQAVKVQVMLHPATNIASAQLQINYDPNLVSVISVTNLGAVGGQFLMGYKDHKGSLDVVMACDQGNCSQSGALLDIHFMVNDGALPGMRTDLIMARRNLGGDYGVNLENQYVLSQSNGELDVVPSASADSDGDGIPDWWTWRYYRHLEGKASDYSMATNILQGSRMSVYEKYVADLDPTNAESALAFTGIQYRSDGVQVDWQGGTWATQYIEAVKDLGSTSELWTVIFTNLPPTATETNIIDTGATNGTLFYRIRAER
jgi:hypothetical protein